MSNNLLKTILGVTDVYSNIDAKSGKVKAIGPLDAQIFYLFESTDEKG